MAGKITFNTDFIPKTKVLKQYHKLYDSIAKIRGNKQTIDTDYERNLFVAKIKNDVVAGTITREEYSDMTGLMYLSEEELEVIAIRGMLTKRKQPECLKSEKCLDATW